MLGLASPVSPHPILGRREACLYQDTPVSQTRGPDPAASPARTSNVWVAIPVPRQGYDGAATQQGPHGHSKHGASLPRSFGLTRKASRAGSSTGAVAGQRSLEYRLQFGPLPYQPTQHVGHNDRERGDSASERTSTGVVPRGPRASFPASWSRSPSWCGSTPRSCMHRTLPRQAHLLGVALPQAER